MSYGKHVIPVMRCRRYGLRTGQEEDTVASTTRDRFLVITSFRQHWKWHTPRKIRNGNQNLEDSKNQSVIFRIYFDKREFDRGWTHSTGRRIWSVSRIARLRNGGGAVCGRRTAIPASPHRMKTDRFKCTTFRFTIDCFEVGSFFRSYLWILNTFAETRTFNIAIVDETTFCEGAV